MSKHKWYHFIGITHQSGSYKNTLLDPQRTVTDHYEVEIKKCDICKEWKVTVHDYKQGIVHEKDWQSRVRAIKWLKDNSYEHIL